MTRISPKTKKSLTKVQQEMVDVCKGLQMHCAHSASVLIFTRNSYLKMLEHENIKDNEEHIQKIKSIILDLEIEIMDINEVMKTVHETMEFIPTKKKDSKLLKKVQELVSSDKVKSIDLDNSHSKLNSIREKLKNTKEEFGIIEALIEDKVNEVPGEFVEEGIEEIPEDVTKPTKFILVDDAIPSKLFVMNMPFFGEELNMFDYDVDLSLSDQNDINYTKSVNEGGRIKGVVLKIEQPDFTAEHIYLSIPDKVDSSFESILFSNEKLNDVDNENKRVCIHRIKLQLNNNSLQVSGKKSELLKDLSDDTYLGVYINIDGSVDLSNSNLKVDGYCEISIKTISGENLIASDVDIFRGLDIEAVAYEPEFEYIKKIEIKKEDE